MRSEANGEERLLSRAAYRRMDDALRKSTNPYPDWEWEDYLSGDDLRSLPSRVTFDDREIE
jgi:hypothetical protein